MPELPEVESARAVIAARALGRRIVTVDDTDSYECRPHAPGEIAAALVGLRLVEAHRRGKSMWCDTAGPGRSRAHGPSLGLHLGMSGKIVIADANGVETDGGDYWERGRAKGDFRHTRFSLTFADGGRMVLVDPRRLGRVRLDPPLEALGPDARDASPAELRAALTSGTAPVKARLLDQSAMAGVGNLLADQILWLARVDPRQPVASLTKPQRDKVVKAIHTAIEAAVKGGGVHTLSVIEHRKAGGRCPRDGGEMVVGKVGGRTTWWCSKEQVR